LLVYQDDARRGAAIRLRECPAAQQRDARCAEEIRRDDRIEGAQRLVRRQIWLTLDLQSHPARSGGRQIGTSGDRLSAGNLSEAGNQILYEEDLLRSIFVSCLVER